MKKRIFIIFTLMIFCGVILCACSNFCEHEFGEWEIVKKSTCAENGEKARVCIKCGDTETEKLIQKAEIHVPEAVAYLMERIEAAV